VKLNHWVQGLYIKVFGDIPSIVAIVIAVGKTAYHRLLQTIVSYI
jgi:hypothetical protein